MQQAIVQGYLKRLTPQEIERDAGEWLGKLTGQQFKALAGQVVMESRRRGAAREPYKTHPYVEWRQPNDHD